MSLSQTAGGTVGDSFLGKWSRQISSYVAEMSLGIIVFDKSTPLIYRLLLALMLSTLFACASRYLQHVKVYLHALVQFSSLLSASLML